MINVICIEEMCTREPHPSPNPVSHFLSITLIILHSIMS